MATHVSPAVTKHERHEQRSIVVGVDFRGRSSSAVVWAVEAADREGSGLTLVSATRGNHPDDASLGEHGLASLARRLTMSNVRQCIVEGDAVDALLDALLDAAVDAELLVVGARTLRPAQRMILGGTSRALAAWSPVPTVVVPETWMQPSMATSPIVAGIRPAEGAPHGSSGPLDQEVLAFSFNRAAALRVPLIVVSAFKPPYLTEWSASDVHASRSRNDAGLEERLAPWLEAYPDLEVVIRSVAEPADRALLEAAEVAQLAVVGRHHSAVLSGVLGATARGVLARASRPVAVVPSGSRDDLASDIRRRQGRESFWAPTF